MPKGKLAVYESGDKYGIVTLTGKSYSTPDLGTAVEIICNCGKIAWVRLTLLKIGIKKSCGCLNKKNNNQSRRNYGVGKHKLYKSWSDIIQRCTNPNNTSYYNYGGRGITVCEEWKDDSSAFVDWAEKNGWQPDKGLTLDRKNNNKGYYPANCKFATKYEQSRNKRTNIFLTLYGETKCVSDWSDDKRCCVAKNTLARRITKMGWDSEKAILTPPLT